MNSADASASTVAASTDAPAVVVVFAVLNHAATLPAVLRALDATDWPGLRAIAVDCGSSDASASLLAAHTANGRTPLTVLSRPGIGRASALREAMAMAGNADVVRLHADVVPDGTDWLRRLHAVRQQHPDAGVVGAKIVLGSGRIQSCGRTLIGGLGIWPEWSDLRWMEGDRDDAPRAQEVDGVTGELCWITRAALEATGGLDANYDPVFGDDDDFCLLARWHGFRVFVEPGVRAVHFAPRQTQLTATGIAEPTGLVQRQHDDRAMLQRAHRAYFQAKWGFDPEAPDLHEVRRRYGHTRICWRIGEALRQALPATPAVDVCFATWNSRAVLPRMLDQLAATDWPDVRVYVVDNGSTDDTVAYLRQRAATFPFPLHVQTLPLNLGVAQALNLAFQQGTAEIIARLDDDAFVPPDWLRGLVRNFHQRPYAGVVGPRSLNANAGETLQNGPSRGWPGPFPGTGPTARERVLGKARVHAICGCCNLYRRSVFARVGWLDVRFSPSQFDESDHHVAVHQAGYEVIYDGSVTVHHLRQAGRGETPTAVGNFAGNRAKHDAKWAGRQWRAIDRAIDLSIDGRFLPDCGDTSALHAALPPVPAGPPQPVARDVDEARSLLALARKRSLLRGLDGPLAASFAAQVQLCEQLGREGHAALLSLVSRLRDLWNHDAGAQRALAAAFADDGEPQLAARHATWASWLDGRPSAPTRAPVLIPRAEAAHAPVAVVLVPTMEHDAETERIVARTAAALAMHGVSHRVERALVPQVADAEVVHLFGTGDVGTLRNRVQAVRAMQPSARIVWSPLRADADVVRWHDHVFGSHYFGNAAELQRLHRAAAHGQLEVSGRRDRRLPAPPDADHAAYERAALAFVDQLVTFTDDEADRWCSTAPGVPIARLDEPAWLPTMHGAHAVASNTVLAIGPRDLAGNHLALTLALADSGLTLTLAGNARAPYGDWHLQRLGGPRLVLAGEPAQDQLGSLLRSAAVCVWLPASPVSLVVPRMAQAIGCPLVLPRDPFVQQCFGGNAHYVDPCDLEHLRATIEHAASGPRAATGASTSLFEHGEQLLAVYRRHDPVLTTSDAAGLSSEHHGPTF